MNTQALSAPISSLSLLLVQTQAARWKAARPEQLTGAHLYIDIAKVRLHLSWVFLWYVAEVSPLYKKSDNLERSNHRPVSVLSCTSKIFEKVYCDQMYEYFMGILSHYLSSFRKMYGCNHVLLKLVEDWKYALDRGEHVGAILMDLSKAFDCLPIFCSGVSCMHMELYAGTQTACKNKFYQKWVAPTLKRSASRVRIGSSPIQCFH